MPLGSVSEWMDDYTGGRVVWYVKRLSGNDTLANGSHQGGPYVPKPVLFSVFKELHAESRVNPDVWFQLFLDSHPDVRRVRAVWYNNKIRGGTRDEARITGFGGKSSPFLDPESTGAIAIFAFVQDDNGSVNECHVWISRDGLEEDLIEERTGPIEPGTWMTMTAGRLPTLALDERPSARASCRLSLEELPEEWRKAFPSASEIVTKAVALRSSHGMNPDQRLIARRRCELELFRSVEDAIDLPRIRESCSGVEAFLEAAQEILQRRRSRANASLGLHMRQILVEEGFREGSDFEGAQWIDDRAFDFVFPNWVSYRDETIPVDRLRNLSVMVTCRDRWHQVLGIDARADARHILTLQEGVSENQFRAMRQAKVMLVVPEALRESYPAAVRPDLLSLESFLADVRLLS
jgi:hypothetical protein